MDDSLEVPLDASKELSFMPSYVSITVITLFAMEIMKRMMANAWKRRLYLWIPNDLVWQSLAKLHQI